MRPSDEFLRQQAQERTRGKLRDHLENLDALIERLESVIEVGAFSASMRKGFAQTLLTMRPRRDRLRKLLGDDPAYEWIIHKGVIRGLPLN